MKTNKKDEKKLVFELINNLPPQKVHSVVDFVMYLSNYPTLDVEKPVNLAKEIARGMEDVLSIESGKKKAKTAREFFNEF